MKIQIALLIAWLSMEKIGAQEVAFTPLANRYAVIIGVTEYANSAMNLKYAAKDAEDFAKALFEKGRFKKENVRILTDADANREKIRKSIEGWLRQNAKKDDLVLIFFSGHGTQLADIDGDEDDGIDEALVPYDYDQSDVSTAIDDDSFALWIRNLPSENIFIVLDCCYSGGAARQKGVTGVGMKGSVSKDDFLTDIVRELPKKGTSLLAASKADQVSFEEDEFSNGVFSHFLLESITPDADVDMNNVIDEKELSEACRKRTVDYTSRRHATIQEPVFISRLANSLPLFYLPSPKASSTDKDSLRILMLQVDRFSRQPSKRLPFLERAFKLDPDNFLFGEYLARTHMQLGHYDKALHYFEIANSKALDSHWGENAFSAGIGEALAALGRHQEAIEWYGKARESDEVLVKVADSYLALGDTGGAITYLNSSLRLNPFQRNVLFKLFYIHYSQGQQGLALSQLSKLSELDPTDLEFRYWDGMFQKYIKGNPAKGDSVLRSFYQNPILRVLLDNVREQWKRILLVVDETTSLRGQEVKKYYLDEALLQYPYCEEFIKEMVAYGFENNDKKLLDQMLQKYQFYCRLNVDHKFIQKHAPQTGRD